MTPDVQKSHSIDLLQHRNVTNDANVAVVLDGATIFFMGIADHDNTFHLETGRAQRTREVNDVLRQPTLGCGVRHNLLRRPHLGMHGVEQFLRLGALDPCDVVLILEQHAERIGHGRGIERHDIELGQCGRPVERFRDTRRLEQVQPAQRLNEMQTSCDSFLAMPGTLARTILSSRSAVG